VVGFSVGGAQGCSACSASRTNSAGSTATFKVDAASFTPLAYQWLKNGVSLTNGGNLSGARSATLNVSDVSRADEGSFSVFITNGIGAAVSWNAGLTVIDPVIATQTANLTNKASTTATFEVDARGTQPLTYRWMKDGANPLTDHGNISGSTTATLTVSNVLKADEGSYHAVVTNALGSVNSSDIRLTVIDPAILTQPQSRSMVLQSNVTLTVTAAGTPELGYQWFFNSARIPGAVNTSLNIANFQASNEGFYSLMVTSFIGSAVSEPAALFLNSPFRWVGPRVNGEGRFQAWVVGPPGSNFVILASTDLTDWTWLSTNNAPQGVLGFTDTNAFLSTNRFETESDRFYRARLEP
jgi:hypothetical protein